MKPELQFTLPIESSVEYRIQQFKDDEEKMQDMCIFIENLLSDAQNEAQRQLDIKAAAEERSKTTLSLAALKNKKIVVRARTYFRGVFEAISNCTASSAFPSFPVRRS